MAAESIQCACCFHNPLKRDGTSQRQRLEAALDHNYVKIDERGLPDLLLYARQYAQLLQFYSPSNNAGGDWLAFIDNDETTQVAIVQLYDVQNVKDGFEKQLTAYRSSNLADKQTLYPKLVTQVAALAQQFDQWYQQATPSLSLANQLERLINSVLKESLQSVYGQYLRAVDLGLPILDEALFTLDSIWELDTVTSDTLAFQSAGLADELEFDLTVNHLHGRFNECFDALVFLVDQAKSMLEQTLESYPQHQPHMALFLCFLRLFEYAQNHLNSIGQRHLDFYYQDVLGLTHHPAIPDQVHIIFELAKRAQPQLVKQQTTLLAGKDDEGKNLFYETDNELVVNNTVINDVHGLKNLFIEQIDDLVVNLYGAQDADTEDGIAEPLQNEQGKWPVFGSAKMPYATTGFAVSAPILLLAEGDRRIALTFNVGSFDGLDKVEPQTSRVEQELKHNVSIEASCESGWSRLTTQSVSINNAQKTLTFIMSLAVTDEALVAYLADTHGAGFDSDFPILRFTLNNRGLPYQVLQFMETQVSTSETALTEAVIKEQIIEYNDEIDTFSQGQYVFEQDALYQALNDINQTGFRPSDFIDQHWALIPFVYPYQYFQFIEVNKLTIDVQVGGVQDGEEKIGLKNLVLGNDTGSVDPAKPFFPFGTTPRNGSRFLIGSQEAFGKSVYGISTKLTWGGLPETKSFNSHYATYTQYLNPAGISTPTSNDYFTGNLSILSKGQWQDLNASTAQILFDTTSESPPQIAAKQQWDIGLTTGPALHDCNADALIEADAKLPAFVSFDNGLNQGFISVRLNQSFLHEHYPSVLSQAAIDLPTSSPPQALPNQPYTPLIESFELSYRACESIDYQALTEADFKQRSLQLYQLGPFGNQEIFPVDDLGDKTFSHQANLVPLFTVEIPQNDSQLTSEQTAHGLFYIGLDNLVPGQNLSILFQIAEGSEDPNLPNQPVIWSYLNQTRWIDFDFTEIIQDSTNGLLRSGIVTFAMPKSISTDNTSLPTGSHWIRAAVGQDTLSVPNMIALHPQAATASFADNNNSESHLQSPLPAGSISKLKSRIAAIKSVSQPYASFSGQTKETDQAFYTRASERLRHKQRAVSIYDYERLVLQQFPQIYKAKCINHTSRCSEHAPGYVRMIVVPNLRNQNAIDPLKPQISLNTLTEISDFLQQYASNFVRINVTNPNYEEIKVHFNVQFQAGLDKGFYTGVLNGDIVKFLSPWLYDEGADLTFGGRVHRSSILKYVEDLPYVDFVTDFTMDQVKADGTLLNIEEAVATCASSALVSAATHDIQHDITPCVSYTGKNRCEISEEDCQGCGDCGNCNDKKDNNEQATQVNESVESNKKHRLQRPITKTSRYIGNSRTTEVHDLSNQQQGCYIERIRKDRVKSFRSLDEALKQGYDYCAYCFGKEKSTR